MMYYRPRPVYMGDPGIFGAIGKIAGSVVSTVGKVAKTAAGIASAVIPGPIGTIAGLAAGALPGGAVSTSSQAGGLRIQAPSIALGPLSLTGPSLSLTSSGGATVVRRRYRHMNAGNAKAARRAIRRIKSVRHLLQSIERELPRRPAAVRRSPGVITRSEAARALRS
jgi:hypothetical protein